MRTTTLLLLLVIPGSLFAQKVFGLKGGLNLAKISVSASAYGQSASASSDNLTSFSAGIFFSSHFNEKWGVQTELMYSGQGGKGNSSSGGNGSLNIDYLLVPVMFKFYAAPNFSLQAGPQIGILLGATSAGQNVKDQMNMIDFDANFGAGVMLSPNVELGFRYVLGIANILNTSGAPNGLSLTTTNQVMQFTLAFGLSSKE